MARRRWWSGVDDPAYGAFLNWMYFSDATLTFPQTLVLRYSQLEPEERRNPQVAGDYAKWFLGRLRAVEAATANAETLCAGRFTAADIVNGYALRLAGNIGLAKDFGPNVAAYWARLQERDGYQAGGGGGTQGGRRAERGASGTGLIDAVIPGAKRTSSRNCPGISRFRVRCFASPRNDVASIGDSPRICAMVDLIAAAKEPREEDEPWTTTARNPAI